LLTSSGLRTASLTAALRDLLGKPFGEASVAFIPTASVAAPGHHGWLVDDLNRLAALGWRELDIVGLNGLPREHVLARLRRADVLYAEGGNHYHLARSISANGLTDGFRELLETKVYVGVSAGSMIFSRNLNAHSAGIMDDLSDLELLGASEVSSPFGLFDWYIKPHLNSASFAERDEEWARRLMAAVDFPLYLLDDASAVRVRGERGEQIDVVSEGTWHYTDGR
jgi:dipeptidase E